MCGIVGYVGKKNSVPVLIDGLKRLEYRGYDSAGIAIIKDNAILISKQKGKIAALESILPKNLSSSIGIAHTRWATHGIPDNINAHPHLGHKGKVAIVHNGIIENYASLKKKLENEGVIFKSQTDSEVICNLIEKYYKDDFEEAFVKAVFQLEGTYGIVALCADKPDTLLVARKGSPLCLGIGEDEFFIGSDVSAFIAHTRQVVYLNDYEIASVTSSGFTAKDYRLTELTKEINTIDWDINQIEKGEFAHFMLKEIFEQPESMSRAFAGRIQSKLGNVRLGGLNMTPSELLHLDSIRIVGCGTSFHAGLVGSYAIEELSRLNCFVEIASEARYKNPIVKMGTLYFVISQSGETADTLSAMKEIQRKGGRVLGICNVVGSTIPRESDGGIYVHSGPEISVASTKAFTSQLTALYLFAIMMGRMRDVSFNHSKKLLAELENIPSKIQSILSNSNEIKKVASAYLDSDNFLFLGRGISYPVALEGALKLKEISYKHAEGIASGEIKHGPIALIDKQTPIIFIAPEDGVYDKTLSNMQEVKARGGRIITICYEGDEKVKEFSDHIIYIPRTEDVFSPMLTIIPLQLFAYYMAAGLGCDIDQPRNLAKSVTVE